MRIVHAARRRQHEVLLNPYGFDSPPLAAYRPSKDHTKDGNYANSCFFLPTWGRLRPRFYDRARYRDRSAAIAAEAAPTSHTTLPKYPVRLRRGGLFPPPHRGAT